MPLVYQLDTIYPKGSFDYLYDISVQPIPIIFDPRIRQRIVSTLSITIGFSGFSNYYTIYTPSNTVITIQSLDSTYTIPNLIPFLKSIDIYVDKDINFIVALTPYAGIFGGGTSCYGGPGIPLTCTSYVITGHFHLGYATTFNRYARIEYDYPLPLVPGLPICLEIFYGGGVGSTTTVNFTIFMDIIYGIGQGFVSNMLSITYAYPIYQFYP